MERKREGGGAEPADTGPLGRDSGIVMCCDDLRVPLTDEIYDHIMRSSDEDWGWECGKAREHISVLEIVNELVNTHVTIVCLFPYKVRADFVSEGCPGPTENVGAPGSFIIPIEESIYL